MPADGGRGGAGRGTSSGCGTLFAEAFADVGELTVAMEERMEAIERDVAIGEEATAMKKRKGQFERRDGASRPIPRFRSIWIRSVATG